MVVKGFLKRDILRQECPNQLLKYLPSEAFAKSFFIISSVIISEMQNTLTST